MNKVLFVFAGPWCGQYIQVRSQFCVYETNIWISHFIYVLWNYIFIRIYTCGKWCRRRFGAPQVWINWSLRRFLKSLWDRSYDTGGSHQTGPSPLDVNKNFILCIHWWFSLTLNRKHLLNSTLLVPLYNRIHYLTHKTHALCDHGNLANSP